MTTKRTTDLAPGDQIIVGPRSHLTRTVREVRPLGFVTRRGQQAYGVYYAEPAELGVWGEGNSTTGDRVWTLVN